MNSQRNPALGDQEQAAIRESLANAEGQSSYFGATGQRALVQDRWLATGTCVLSLGVAGLMFASTSLNVDLTAGLLALAAAVLSAVTLAQTNSSKAGRAFDLSQRWKLLASAYKQLWSRIQQDDATKVLRRLRDEESQLKQATMRY